MTNTSPPPAKQLGMNDQVYVLDFYTNNKASKKTDLDCLSFEDVN